MELWNALDELFAQFWDHFSHLDFQIPEDKMDWKFIKNIFQYLLHVFENPHDLESFEPLPT